MTRELLTRLADRYTFDGSPSFADLGAYHVPFDELVAGARVERTIGAAVRRGERLVIVADSGSGKSSIISHALGPAVGGVAPIVVPVRPLEDGATRPLVVADEILSTIPLYASEVATLGDSVAASGAFRRVTRKHGFSSGVGLALGWLRGDLAGELSTQTETEHAVSIAEKTAVLAQAFEQIQAAGLQPIVVFDDTDSWLADRDAARITGFMRDTVKWLSQLPTSVVVAAHRRYLESEQDRLEFLDTRVEVPSIGHADGLSSILARRVQLNVQGTRAAGTRLAEVMTADAVESLFEAYVDGASLRRVVQLAHMALNEAVNAQADVITADHIVAAQRSG